jgi:hypothetical protein
MSGETLRTLRRLEQLLEELLRLVVRVLDRQTYPATQSVQVKPSSRH